MKNSELYETDEVIAKYARNSVRTNSLNIPEIYIYNKYLQEPKKILDVGCGTGRASANFYLYGHEVKGIDLSEGMIMAARKKFAKQRFPELGFQIDDAIEMSKQIDNYYDIVFFTMNTIDYIETLAQRKSALLSAKRVLNKNGLLIITSHNHKAYPFTYKNIFSTPLKRRFKYLKNTTLFQPIIREEEHVTGGGTIWKSSPEYMIDFCTSAGFDFLDWTVDARHKIDRIFARSLKLSTYIFDYFLYVFERK